jgi:glyoxylase-like metal-dependent hydrolase (beta-lactamase superfamily II)
MLVIIFTMKIAWSLACLACLACSACGGAAPVGRTPEGAQIVRIPLRLSNAYLVKTPTPILVDTGTLGDLEDLDAALRESGVRTTHLGLVVLTHAHADHAGLASELRRISGARVAIGAGDVAQAQAGENDPLRPTGFTGAALKPFIPSEFPETVADIVVREHEPVDLSPWGVSGKLVAMPGHTRGSVVVVLDNHAAFVGDMMLGGTLGGLLFPGSPGEHYYQADREQNRRNIRALLDQGVATFYLGHGGPVAREDVTAAFP